MKRFLLLVTVLQAGGILPLRGQVIESPYLNCVAVNNSGDVVLEWTLPTVTCGPFIARHIYRATNAAGPYNLVASVTNPAVTSYVDPVGNGSSQVYYYYMENSYNCPGYSVEQSDTLDNLQPLTPEITVATVNNGFAELHWQVSPSPETYGYIIYKLVTAFNPYDTVYGKYVTSYVDLNSQPGTDTMSYSVAAIDSCFNASLFNVNPHRTIFLKADFDRCQQKVLLEWTPYVNWTNGVLQYRIYVSVNGGPMQLARIVGGDTTAVVLKGYDDGDQLCFTVTAQEKITGVESVSNERCVVFNVVQPAHDFFIRNVQVSGAGVIEVSYSLDPLADLTQIKVERSVDRITYSAVQTISPPNDLSGVLVFSDQNNPLTDRQAYYYRLIATDSCGGRDTSSVGRSLLLLGYAFTDLTFYLQWNASELDYAQPLQYELFRNDGQGFVSAGLFPPDERTYYEAQSGNIQPCYYVEAIDSVMLPNGVQEVVRRRSNVVCLDQPSQIYVPNAFAPGGVNATFKPLINADAITSYRMQIFNRWGEIIFTSSDPDQGWDGRYRGSLMQQGAYAYVIELTDGNGKRVEAKGTVLLLR
ncbi:MAG: gliding motility-associated C-terminal domain-containing protein [Chitinophagales bacterium]|nr:gliding motility-associated C-terminal domain-containing protein [Chitinophagales bacterium]MDW8393304.1 gliding motility-associated C-terminal domain-containing protein [Chitinophagales bacterium]